MSELYISPMGEIDIEHSILKQESTQDSSTGAIPIEEDDIQDILVNNELSQD